MEQGNDRHDVIVVGGGLAGLTAAVTAARAGARVLVLERREELGGRASTHRANGFSLNEGAHAFYDGGPARRILTSLGVTLRGGRPSPNGSLGLRGGALQPLPGGLVSLLSTGLFDLSEKLELARLLASLPRRDRTPFRERPFSEFLDAHVSRPRVREMLVALARLSTFAAEPERMDGAVALTQLALALDPGVRYLHGGFRSIVESLEACAKEAGVTFVGGAASAVEPHLVHTSDGRRFEARNVVLAVGPQVAAKLTGSAALDAFAAAAIPVRVSCLDLAVRALPFPRRTLLLGLDEPLYYSVHSNAANLAPKGAAVVHLMRYLREDEQGSVAALEALFDRLQPGAEVLVRRAMPSMTVYHHRPDPHAPGAGIAVPDVPGVFVAGDWVGSDALLTDAAVASGHAVGRALAGLRSHRAVA